MKTLIRSGAFLQSNGWAEIQQRSGHEVLTGEIKMTKQSLGPFCYWYAGRVVFQDLLSAVAKQSGSLSKAIMVRFDAAEEGELPPTSGMRVAPHDVQPRTTVLLDLTKDEQQLLSEMHQKCRYNIRVAEREEVTVKITNLEDTEIFLSLLSQTTERDDFRAHPKSYYKKLLESTNDPDLNIFLALAFVQEKPAAAAIICDYKGTRTYLHGASDYELRSKMAPYALHWFLIRDAKTKGITSYDFWGIAPTDDPHESLFGVTRFKKGWGGEIIRYPKTHDLILRPILYRMYRLAHRFLRP